MASLQVERVEGRPNTPRRLGLYRIEEELAHSTICVTYRAVEESLGRSVIIKKLHPHMANDPEVRARFEREARVCALVRHDNVVEIYRYEPDPYEPYIVLEYVEGANLKEWVKRKGPLPWTAILIILYQALKGLTNAHQKQVIHRDIKPDNILINRQGQVKIADFGLATHPGEEKVTLQGNLVGTPSYMPPEVISGQEYEPRSDLYSLGASIYEALTGEPPVGGTTITDIVHNILSGKILKPSQKGISLPQDLESLVMRLLEKNPHSRPYSAEQALWETERIAQQQGVELSPARLVQLLEEKAQPPSLPSTELFPKKPKVPFYRLWWFWLPTLVLVMVVIMGIFINPTLRPRRIPVNVSPPAQEEMKEPVFTQTEQPSPMNKTPIATPEEKSSPHIPQATAPSKQPSSPPMSIIPTPVPQEKPPPASPPSPPDTSSSPSLPTSRSEETEGATKTTGYLRINLRPWAEVVVDNIHYGTTPLASPLELPEGEHQIVLSNPEFPLPVVKTVTIQKGKTILMDVNLWEQFGQVIIRQVKPWAEIWVDGRSWGYTPRARPIILPFGKHRLELKRDNYRPFRLDFELKPGEPPLEIRVELEPL